MYSLSTVCVSLFPCFLSLSVCPSACVSVCVFIRISFLCSYCFLNSLASSARLKRSLFICGRRTWKSKQALWESYWFGVPIYTKRCWGSNTSPTLPIKSFRLCFSFAVLVIAVTIWIVVHLPILATYYQLKNYEKALDACNIVIDSFLDGTAPINCPSHIYNKCLLRK